MALSLPTPKLPTSLPGVQQRPGTSSKRVDNASNAEGRPIPAYTEEVLEDGTIVRTHDNGYIQTIKPGEQDPGPMPTAKSMSAGDAAATAANQFGKEVGEFTGLKEKDAGPGPDPFDPRYYGPAETRIADTYGRSTDIYRNAGEFRSTPLEKPGTITPGTITPTKVDAPEFRGAHDAGPVERYSGTRVDRPEDVVIGPLAATERVQGVDLRASKDVGPVSVGRAAPNAAVRSLLTDAAYGKTPSKAELQMYSGIDRVGKQIIGGALAARGADRVGLKREALLKTGDLGAEAVGKAAELRAGEMATARGQLSDFEQQATALEQQANNLQAEIDKAIAQGNQAQANALTIEQGRLRQQAQALNAQATNARTMDEAQLRATTARGNIDAATGVAVGNAARTDAAAAFGAGAANTRAESLARRADETDQQYLARLQAFREAYASRDMAAQGANVSNRLTADTTNAANVLKYGESEAQRQQQDQQLRQTGQIGAVSVQNAGTGNLVDIGSARLGANRSEKEAERERNAREARARLQTTAAIGSAIL